MKPPKNRAEIGRAVCAITEKALPLPRMELCQPIGDMERELIDYVESVLLAAYQDARPEARS